jgi:hypothetical protein
MNGMPPTLDATLAGVIAVVVTLAPSLLLWLAGTGILGASFGLHSMLFPEHEGDAWLSGLGLAFVWTLSGLLVSLAAAGTPIDPESPLVPYGIGVPFVLGLLLPPASVLRRWCERRRWLRTRERIAVQLPNLAQTLERRLPQPAIPDCPGSVAGGFVVGFGLGVLLLVAGPLVLTALAPDSVVTATKWEWALPGAAWAMLGAYVLAVFAHSLAAYRRPGRPPWLLDWPPGFCLSFFLAVVSAGLALVVSSGAVALAALALVVVGAIAGSRPRHRYPLSLPLFREVPSGATSTEAVPSPKCSAANHVSLDERSAQGKPWAELERAATGHRKESGPLVLVAVSGGGIRAAVWACLVLRELDVVRPTAGSAPASEEEDWRELVAESRRTSTHASVIFGASGGMVGAVHYANALRSQGADALKDPRFIGQVGSDGLRWLVQRFLFHDAFWANTPVAPRAHRGVAFEEQWAEKLGLPPDGLTFGYLQDGDGRCVPPHLVFSPMAIEDGRRLLFSDLHLADLCTTVTTELKAPPASDGNGSQPAVPAPTFQSRSAVEASCLFPETWRNVSLLEAARASATFPFVMPISSLPTHPRRRLVDAGYYDNYGVGLAAAWLEATLADEERRKWLGKRSGVLVIQIRDGVLFHSLPLGTLEKESRRIVEQTLGPAQAVLGFSNAVQLYENDEDLAKALGSIQKAFPSMPVATVSFEFGGTAPLSWTLSTAERHALTAYARTQIASKILGVQDWLARAS